MNENEKKEKLIHVEKQLVPRLKFMGYLLFFFSVCSLSYAFFIQVNSKSSFEELSSPGLALTEELLNLESKSLLPEDIFNFFFVALIFAIVGSYCMFTAWKRKKLYLLENSYPET